MLDTGIPNLYYPTAPAIITGASSTNPLLIYPAPPAGPDESGPCPAPGGSIPPCVLTSQYNNARQDANLYEPILSSSNVAGGTFGNVKVQYQVDNTNVPTGFTDNPIYAQPLYAYNLSIGNILFVATLNGEVYAFNADSTTTPGAPLWERADGNCPVGGCTGPGMRHNCDSGTTAGTSTTGQLPYLDFAGVVSTPVIDIDNQVIYVVNECTNNVNGFDYWCLNALDLTTGATLTPGGIGVNITYSVQSSGPPSWQPSGPQQGFNPVSQMQRASLALTGDDNGHKSVLVGFGTGAYEGGAMAAPYQGWMFDYNVETPSATALANQTNPFSTQCLMQSQTPTTGSPSPPCNLTEFTSGTGTKSPNPCSDGGGIWDGSRAPAITSSSDVVSAYFAAGNGGFQFCPQPGCNMFCTTNPPHCQSPACSLTYTQQFTDWGEAVMKINMSDVWNYSGSSSQPAPFWPRDYFVSSNIPTGLSPLDKCGSDGTSLCTSYLQITNWNDWDTGIWGVVAYDDCYYQAGVTNCDTSMAFSGNKRGDGYAMLQSTLGQYQSPDVNVSTTLLTQQNPTCSTEIAGPQCDEIRSLAYWKPSGIPAGTGGFLVGWPWSEALTSFQWLQATSSSQYAFAMEDIASVPWTSSTLFPGGTLALTVNPSVEGTCNSTSDAAAVVWVTAAPGAKPPQPARCGLATSDYCYGYLLAYKLDAGETPCTTGTLTQIWPLTLPTQPDFYKAPYAIPTVVNGKAYVPTYALYDSTNGSYDKSGIQVYACSTSNCSGS